MDINNKKFDLLIALLFSLVTGIVVFSFCNNAHPQGDDFAAYILQAKALADGTLSQQLRLNVFLHPSIIYAPASESLETLTYVWGFPLMLLPIYLLFGFDISQSLCIYYYKLPGIFSFCLFAGVLFLFYRRRFGRGFSLVLCLCMVFSIMEEANHIQTDIPFLLFSMLCFLLSEHFFSQTPGKIKLATGFALGLSMWAAVETRLNGFTVSLLILLEHLFVLWKQKPRGRDLAVDLFPHLLLLALTGITALLLPIPNSNLSDVGLGSIKNGLIYFYSLFSHWCILLTSYDFLRQADLLAVLAVVLFMLGLVSHLRQESAYALLILGTVLVTSSLPYGQGLRYFYNILPLLLLFIAYGVCVIFHFLQSLWNNIWYRRFLTFLATTGLIVFSVIRLSSVYSVYSYILCENQEYANVASKNLYSESCIEAYDFLINNTESDAVVAFCKPRALYLNSGRVSFRVGLNGHTIEDADYYMEFTENYGKELSNEIYSSLDTIFDNGQIRIYRRPDC